MIKLTKKIYTVISKCFHLDVLAAEFDKYYRIYMITAKSRWDLLDGLASQLEEEKYTTGTSLSCTLSYNARPRKKTFRTYTVAVTL